MLSKLLAGRLEEDVFATDGTGIRIWLARMNTHKTSCLSHARVALLSSVALLLCQYVTGLLIEDNLMALMFMIIFYLFRAAARL